VVATQQNVVFFHNERPIRIDVWDDAGDSIYDEHVVGSEDFEVAVAAFLAVPERH
jgi:hypothetical protein